LLAQESRGEKRDFKPHFLGEVEYEQ